MYSLILESVDEGTINKTDFQNFLQNLQKENHELKKELSSVQSLNSRRSSTSHHSHRLNSSHGSQLGSSYHSNIQQASHHSNSHHSSNHSTHPQDSWYGDGHDTYNGFRRTFSGSINRLDTPSQRWRAKQRFDDAVTKYRLEIYKNRSENPRASPFYDESEEERIKSLEAEIFRVKLENLQERTEKEKIRLELDHLQTCFEALNVQYNELNIKTRHTVEHYDQRLQDAFDRLHGLRYSNKRRRSSKLFFWKNSKANIKIDDDEKFLSNKVTHVI